MARHPASDERSVLGPIAKHRRGERFFLAEVALFLRTSRPKLALFLRDQGMLQRLRLTGGWGSRLFTTARGFALACAHFRAIQGEREQLGVKRALRARRARRAKR